MKKAVILILALTLSVLSSACSGTNITTGQASTATLSSASNVKIGMLTQEYIGDNIAEIPLFISEEQSSEIDLINAAIKSEILENLYNDFMNSVDNDSWIEIKSYPFTSDEYTQVVIYYNTYPTYAIDGYITSYNYDNKQGKWIRLEDVMIQSDVAQDTLPEKIRVAYTGDGTITSAKATGFIARDGLFQLLIEAVIDHGEAAEPERALFIYSPGTDELTRLKGDALFPADELDQLDPPLSYQN